MFFSSSLRKFFATACVTLAAVATVPSAQAAGTYAKTKYPIVLVHGFLGFNSVLGINYFYGVADKLRADGATVYVAQVNPSQTTEYRGEQLVQQMKQWAAKDGVTRFNLIGHSQGGPTVRYAAAVVPGMVSSVGTIAGTHFGSAVADQWIASNAADSTVNSVATSLLKLLNTVYGGSSQSINDTSVNAALASLSTAGALAFNAKYPQGAPGTPSTVNGIPYYSASGNKVATNGWDISDLILSAAAGAFGNTPNDGLVSTSSSHWGVVLKDNYPWNHLDEINQVLGLIGSGAPDPVAFYDALANRLKSSGL